MDRRPWGTRWEGVLLVGAVVLGTALFAFFLYPRLNLPDPTGLIRNMLTLVIVLGTTWVVLHGMGMVFERLSWAKGSSQAHARSVWRVVTYVVSFGVLIVLVFLYLGDVTSTALGLGILGAGVAFVLQQPLLNIVGWVLITTRQMFRIGDRVEITNVRGYVVDIGLMFTELQEFGGWMDEDIFTGRTIEMPNAVVIREAIKNYTRDFPHVWDRVEALVTYESDIDAAKDHMTAAAIEVVGGVMFEKYEEYRRRLPIRDLEKSLPRTPDIRMTMSDSGVRLAVFYFCPAEQRSLFHSQISEKIWRRLTEDPAVDIAYPHMHLVAKSPSRGGERDESVPVPGFRDLKA